MFDFLKNIYDLLVFDYTFLGMFICGLLLGFSFGIFQVINSLNVKLPDSLHGIIVILCILLGIAGFLLLFPMAINLLFEGFFRGLLLTLLGIIVSIAVFYFPIRTAKKKD